MRFLLVAPWLLPIALGIFVWSTVVNVPMFDEWVWAPLIVKMHHGTLSIGDIWAQQDVHRSFFPTLIALALARIFGWNIRVEVVASVAIVALTQLVLYRFLLTHLPRPRAAVAFAASSLLLYSLVQSENWVWGFQISWFLVNLCVVAVITLLAALRLRPASPAYAQGDTIATTSATNAASATIAAIAAIGASYSLIFGLGTWVAGAAILVRLRAWRQLAVWLGLAVATTAVYFAGFKLPSNESGFLAGLNPLDAIQFFFAYLGAPLGLPAGRWVSEALGVGYIVAAAFAYPGLRKQSSALCDFVLGSLTFTIVAAIMETAGRAASGPDAAVNSRYSTTASLGWIGLAVAVCASWPTRRRAITLGAAGVFALIMVFIDGVGWINSIVLAAFQETARETVAHVEKASDDDIWPFYNAPARLRLYLRELQAVRDGPFLRQDPKRT